MKNCGFTTFSDIAIPFLKDTSRLTEMMSFNFMDNNVKLVNSDTKIMRDLLHKWEGLLRFV
eukprot:snap_masked-scaffold_5-processed-gene-5.23-mRNA-1 protein AED:1.00 eAED:1.00 QI:0/0/0/0/1/1/2/0/60